MPESGSTGSAVDGAMEEASGELPNLLTVYDSLPEGIRRTLDPWKGDLPEMVDRRLVRLLTVYEPQYFGFDGRRQVGTVAEGAVLLEKFINERLDRKDLKIGVLIIPVSRDLLIPFLQEGRGDIAAAGLTITPQRLEQVEFTDPLATGVSEVVVTGAEVDAPGRLEDLGSLEIHVRRSSSYWESLQDLDRRLREAGSPPLRLRPADELLDDSDLLELVAAGSIPATVIDDYQGKFWSQIFPDLVLHPELALRTNASVGWALRKGSPDLRELLDDFVREHRQGTLLGNMLIKRYTQDTTRVMRARHFKYARALSDLRGIFQRHGSQYDLDWVLLAAQAFQESRFENDARSNRGAVGIMQIKPETAREVGVADISTVDANVRAGAAYVRHLIDHYFNDPELDDIARQVFAVAGYNAGPARIGKLRQKTASAGLDPNRWFDTVEVMVSREVGSATVRYVSTVVKYYITFSLMLEDRELYELRQL